MAQEYLALLNSAANVTSQVFGQINQNLANASKIQLETNQQELQARGQALGIIENARMHDATIAQMNHQAAFKAKEFAFQSELQAKTYELQNEIQPLRVANERMRLEATKNEATLRTTQNSLSLFDRVAGQYNYLAGNEWLNSGQSPEHLAELNSWSANWATKIAQGEKFDAAAYTKGLQDIGAKYKSNGPIQTPSWNDQSQGLATRFSPAIGEIYGHSNPAVAGTRAGLSTSMLDLDLSSKLGQESNLESNTKLQRLTTPTEYANFDHNATIYRNNKMSIQAAMQERENIIRTTFYKGDQKDPALLAQENKINSLLEQNNKIRESFAKGIFDVHEAEIIDPKAAARQQFQLPSTLPKGSTVAGIGESLDESDVRTGNQREQIFNIGKAIGVNFADPKSQMGTIAENFSASYFAETGDTLDEGYDFTYANNVKTQALDNLDKMEDASGYVSKKFTKVGTEQMLKEIKKPTMVPLSEEAKDIIIKNGIFSPGVIQSASSSVGPYGGINRNPSYYLAFGAGGLDSSEEVFAILNDKNLSKAERELLRKELFSSVYAASVTSALKK